MEKLSTVIEIAKCETPGVSTKVKMPPRRRLVIGVAMPAFSSSQKITSGLASSRNCKATGGRLYQQKHGGEIMWIMLSDCFLSIVSKDCGPVELLVRARRAGDIEKVFPDAKVIKSTNTDYAFRAVLPRSAVKAAIASQIDNINYGNFKNSVEDTSLHAAYVGVWCAMAGLQHPPPEIERSTHARSALTSKNAP